MNRQVRLRDHGLKTCMSYNFGSTADSKIHTKLVLCLLIGTFRCQSPFMSTSLDGSHRSLFPHPHLYSPQNFPIFPGA